jgi:hypothetical protein
MEKTKEVNQESKNTVDFLPIQNYHGGVLIWYEPLQTVRNLDGCELSRAVPSLYLKGSFLKLIVWDGFTGELLAESDLNNSLARRYATMRPEDTEI